MGIGHEQMAKHPYSFGPFPLVSADAEEIHKPVQVGLEVCLLHAGEPEQVSPEPRAEVVHELHGLEVSRVGHVGLVGLVGALGGLHDGCDRSMSCTITDPGAMWESRASLIRLEEGLP